MQMGQAIMPADVLVVLGSRDDRVANYAATLLENSIAPICVVTGGIAHGHDLLATKWQEGSEAEHFAGIMLSLGVAEDRIYIEDNATNTGQNALFTYDVLTREHIHASSILVVTKLYMERRALATFQVQWPDQETVIRVCSVAQTIDQYCSDEQPLDAVVNIMVGDLERIIEYPKRGLSKQQQVPANVAKAFGMLKNLGYTNHLINDR